MAHDEGRIVVIEQNDYLPFGTRVAVKSSPSNLYRYNGKEEKLKNKF